MGDIASLIQRKMLTICHDQLMKQVFENGSHTFSGVSQLRRNNFKHSSELKGEQTKSY